MLIVSRSETFLRRGRGEKCDAVNSERIQKKTPRPLRITPSAALCVKMYLLLRCVSRYELS
jgi:hypothetical protein